MARLFHKGFFSILVLASVALLVFHVMFLSVSIQSRRVIAGVLGLEGMWARMLYFVMVVSDISIIILLLTALRRGVIGIRSALVIIFFSILALNLPALFYMTYLIFSSKEVEVEQ